MLKSDIATICTEHLAFHTKLGLVCSILIGDVCSSLPCGIVGATICVCDYYEQSRYDLVSYVLKVSVNFRSVDRNIKLALDALKELGVFNSL